jgi:probable F420-dependent oxidoreductase
VAVARQFRFGVVCKEAPSRAAWLALVRRAEALGYAIVLLADHLLPPYDFAPLAALAVAAEAAPSLRVGATVFANDYRHPALLAKEAATLDVLTEGRFEFGLGAGWWKAEYDGLGVAFDPPAVRVARLEEGLAVVKALWGEGPVTFAGAHYRIEGLEGRPKPVQRPHPPVFVGGGGRRLLALAGREADIVGIVPRALPGGGLDWNESSDEAVARKVGWVRAAAGARFDRLELAALLQYVAVGNPAETAEAEAAALLGMPAERVAGSPECLIGSLEQAVERLQEWRERHGISYLSVHQKDLDALAPVVARLAGT